MAPKGRTNVWNIVGFSLVVTLILGILIWLVFYLDDPEVDSTTSCPREPGYTKVSLTILLDATDTYGPGQRLSLINRVWDEVDALDVYDRVKIYMVEGGKQVPLQNLCKPGRSMQDSPMQQQFQEVRFKELIGKALQRLEGERAVSPIVESLGWVAADRERDGSERRILLVSDLLEYSDVISHYSPDWRQYYERNRQRIHGQCPNLENERLHLLIPIRPEQPNQNNDLVEWWLEYLASCGGYVNSVARVTGAG